MEEETQQYQLVLASASPRRVLLLQQIGIEAMV
jgi:predicted house-cleaning NTP pyrophosphatase (Maf/HAM1 superfamily)